MILFHCPHCGGPLTLEMLEADERYRAALPLLAGLGDLASLALRYAEKWAPPRKALQARKLVAILEELDRLAREKSLKKGRGLVPFERIDLKRALEVCAERAFEPPLSGHAFLYSVIVNKRESRLSYEEKKRERELQTARPEGSAPLDPSTLPRHLRESAERRLPPGEKSE
ncbi:MAG: hypothetical protein A3F84_10365 [Candidatus Handelsmanbacteria bacterium RIFCSPLOWO2_12_FULL_64_10]|uniref:Uncharacterized protein n=1 Tax=Handelsmanbacteria sp. (strain RIFCSPLOWO2_12_FULL_64_10) TaxID=1817868 RepID=A0A1F6CAG7_HANXR|nr:MAG: hypothetical protein A3F84_10365 [Candidatus Handelsmanbacteria bacterium RIFCSPLOWO2_12_FULL_64_10]